MKAAVRPVVRLYSRRAEAKDDQHQQRAQEGAERPQPRLAHAEQPRPQPEQPVIQGRVDIVGRIAGDLGERARRQGGAVTFIRPQALRTQVVETQPRGDHQDDQQQKDEHACIASCVIHAASVFWGIALRAAIERLARTTRMTLRANTASKATAASPPASHNGQRIVLRLTVMAAMPAGVSITSMMA